MSTVVALDFSTHEPAPHPAYRRIRLASRALEWLFTGLLALDGLFAALMLAAFLVPFTGQHLGIGPKGMLISGGGQLGAPYAPVSGLPLLQRLAHIPVGLINFVPPLVIFWSLRRLFALYGRGVVFAPDNARCIRWIGAALAANAVAPFLGVQFLTALHLVIDRQWMHAYSLQELILGGVVYVIAMVMQVGHEIEEDRSQFV
jgi:hypothetical protein